MTWLKFILWLCGIYSIYYLLIISWDRLRSSGTKENPDGHILSFTEHVEPVKSFLAEVLDPQSSPIVHDGGISLKKMFSLAREEAIEYIKPVSF